MHLDWNTLSLSGYFEALEASNEANGGGTKEPSEGLQRFVKAHLGKQHGRD